MNHWKSFYCLCLLAILPVISNTARIKSTRSSPTTSHHNQSSTNSETSPPTTVRPTGGSNSLNRRPNHNPSTNAGEPGTKTLRQNVPERQNNNYPVYPQHSTKTFVTWLAAHVQTFIQGINCKSAKRYFTSEGRCEMVKEKRFETMRFYATQQDINAVYSVAIPEGRLRDPDTHQAVAVVDPFPRASFGHLVLVFYVDGMTKLECFERKGLHIGSSLCLLQARRARCRNHYRNLLSAEQQAKKCEINFIPTVYSTTQEGPTRHQTLECLPYLAGFGPCPYNVVTESEIVENCELHTNSKRCYHKVPKVPEARLPLCRLYARCDHAVTLFGGWNDETMFIRHEDHLLRFYNMLKRNGFKKQNIQVFYNGNGNVPLGDTYRHGLPASNKNGVRRHVTTLCRTAVCVDSLVVYLNGPTLSDGSVLLWDNNGDGEAQPSEVYTVDEFLDDITDCDANHVFVFADQSYAGALTSRMRARVRTPVYPASKASWSRVVLLSSGGEYEYSWGDTVNRHWAALSPLMPVSWTYENIGYTHSQTSMLQVKHGQEFTIYGAPIVYGLPMHAENRTALKKEYMGCQDLPAAEWIIQFSSEFNDANPE